MAATMAIVTDDCEAGQSAAETVAAMDALTGIQSADMSGGQQAGMLADPQGLQSALQMVESTA